MSSKFLAIALVSASIFASYSPETQAQSNCPGGVCAKPLRSSLQADRPRMALQAGQPVRNVARASVGVLRGASKVVAAPVKFFRERKPVRKGLARIGRGAVKVLTFRGPIARRIRGRG